MRLGIFSTCLILAAAVFPQSPRPLAWEWVEGLSSGICPALSLDSEGSASVWENPAALPAASRSDLGIGLLFPANPGAGADWLQALAQGRFRLGVPSSRHHGALGLLWNDSGAWASYDANAQYLGDRRSLWYGGALGWGWSLSSFWAMGLAATLANAPEGQGPLTGGLRLGVSFATAQRRLALHGVIESPWLGQSIIRPRFLAGIGFSLIPELRFGIEARAAPEEDTEGRLGFTFQPLRLLQLGASLSLMGSSDPRWQIGLALHLGKLEIILAHGAGGGRFEINQVGLRHEI